MTLGSIEDTPYVEMSEDRRAELMYGLASLVVQESTPANLSNEQYVQERCALKLLCSPAFDDVGFLPQATMDEMSSWVELMKESA